MVESSRQGRSGRSPRLASGSGDPADAPQSDMAAATPGKMRIVDYLHEPHEREDQMGGFASTRRGPSAAISSGSPGRKLFPRCLFPFLKRSPGSDGGRTAPLSRSRHKKRKAEERGEERKGDRTEKSVPFDSKTAKEIDGGAGVRSVEPAAAGKQPGDISFNLGMGVGMAFVLSRWATELNKMKELRVQMEMLLKEIRDEVPKKEVAFGIIRSKDNFASSSSDCSSDVSKCNSFSFQNHKAVFHMEEIKSTMVSDGYLNYEISTENQSKNQLEAELAFELEQLQLNLEGEDSVMPSEQERVELACGTTGSSEICEPQEENNNVYCGVSANDLERKLYELIHARQQERIAELESALELTKKKLVDKEMEVSWWRDTTTLASHPRQHKEILSVNSYEREYISLS